MMTIQLYVMNIILSSIDTTHGELSFTNRHNPFQDALDIYNTSNVANGNFNVSGDTPENSFVRIKKPSAVLKVFAELKGTIYSQKFNTRKSTSSNMKCPTKK